MIDPTKHYFDSRFEIKTTNFHVSGIPETWKCDTWVMAKMLAINFMGTHIIIEDFARADESKKNAILSVDRISPIS